MDNNKLELIKNNIERRGFIFHYIESSEMALDIINTIINREDTIGFSGSITIEELGIAKYLIERGNTIFHRDYANGISREETYKQSSEADWYMTSSNALTEEGILINTDGRCNRVASTLYGPNNILTIVGTNKIVANTDEGIKRIKEIAAPLNAKRLGVPTPCVKTGVCMDCNSPYRICRATVIQTNPSFGKVHHILLINSKLGL